jgi:hypothetical protein
MPRPSWISLLMTLVLLSGCSSISVVSDYDNSIPFSSYKTYRWADDTNAKKSGNILAGNPLIFKRIRNAIDRELAAKGYSPGNNGPVDFTVSVYASVRDRIYYNPPPMGFYYPRGYYHGRYGYYHPYWWGPFATAYEEGTLVIDVIDQRKNEMAWRGIAKGILKSYRDGDELQKDIDEAVTKTLAEFPPPKK